MNIRICFSRLITMSFFAVFWAVLLFFGLSFEAAAAANATASLTPMGAPKKIMEISARYAMGSLRMGETPPTDEEAARVVVAAAKEWKVQHCQIAWYDDDKKTGHGVLLAAEFYEGKDPVIMRPRNEEEAQWLEKSLCYPTTPAELSGVYLENEVVADDDFRGKPVVFESTVSEVAKGAFNRPYVFFPTVEGSLTGLTCYFDIKDPNLRKIRKGSKVTVRGIVKGFLMQDVILERCSVLSMQRQ